jgi:hypothetical protein
LVSCHALFVDAVDILIISVFGPSPDVDVRIVTILLIPAQGEFFSRLQKCPVGIQTQISFRESQTIWLDINSDFVALIYFAVISCPDHEPPLARARLAEFIPIATGFHRRNMLKIAVLIAIAKPYRIRGRLIPAEGKRFIQISHILIDVYSRICSSCLG